MDIKNQILKNDNNLKIKYFNTESLPKAKNLLSISPKDKDNFHRFSYKLYKFNEINRKSKKDSSLYCNTKDLFSNIIIKNYNKKSYIKNLNELNLNTESINSSNNFTKTITYFYSPEHSGKTSLKTIYKNTHRNKYYSLKKNNFLPKMTLTNFRKNKDISSPYNNKDNLNLCLVPLLYFHRNSHSKIKKRGEINSKEVNNKNTFTKSDCSSKKNIINKELQKTKNNIKIRTRKVYVESKTEENDMKPKIRFINLIRELLEETLKINKMFAFFNKQIKDKEKTIKFVGKQRNNSKGNTINDVNF